MLARWRSTLVARYAIGDIQGCAREFSRLLAELGYSPSRDELFLLGDIINRGPGSLEALRHAESIEARVVLGNHDLHWLAMCFGDHRAKRKDTLAELSAAADSTKLAEWLREQPLLIDTGDFVFSHAGVPPLWSLGKARELAAEVSDVIKGPKGERQAFFRQMYGGKPNRWRDDLADMDRLRCVTNYLTRMRFITLNGQLEFASKGGIDDAPDGYLPWFSVPRDEPLNRQLAFGHWAAISGECDADGVHALDTGCVWGQELTALNLDTLERTSVQAMA